MDASTATSTTTAEVEIVAAAEGTPFNPTAAAANRPGRRPVVYPRFFDNMSAEEKAQRVKDGKAFNRNIQKALRAELADTKQKADLKTRFYELEYNKLKLKHYEEVARLRGLIVDLQSTRHPCGGAGTCSCVSLEGGPVGEAFDDF